MPPTAACFVAAVSACVVGSRDEATFGPPGAASADGTATSGGDQSPTTGISADDGADGADGGDSGVKFDTPNTADLGSAGDAGGGDGCDKVDFVFVIDNSGSMMDEQQNLANSFAGFIDEIVETVVTDYHIMVVDTDAGAGGGCTISTIGPADCTAWCAANCNPGCDCTCNGNSCSAGDVDTCDETLGAGKVLDQDNDPCGVEGDRRFMLHTQADLAGTFTCVATVGTVGDGNERPMQALQEAVTGQASAGACNDGFLRDDALLVATVITDEEDAGKSPGDPMSWTQSIVTAKNGDEKAVVALMLVGDTDVAGGLCMPYDGGGDGAEGAPRLRAFADSFTHGQWASVCEPSYTQFFSNAVAVIGTACDDFVPPG